MKYPHYALLFLLFALACGQEDQSAFTPLFDGTSWQGWEGAKDFFRIEDGAIVAGSAERNIPMNQFLCTEREYEDFELRMKVKFTSRENNAGIQFRSRRIPNDHEVIGYQADVGFLPDRPVWGSLYDESRRKRFLIEASPAAVEAALDAEGWNDYRIYCRGPEIKFWLNDQLVLEYEETEADIARTGSICVQIHGGPAAEAWYKDIEIRTLPE
ncbi:3-keto-disaccharide hydrolase [Flavilitoribacter nigricans]|uniref:3-keto-alpha-glucoside-1,2-lyase/3-keto-2-hydroxy-glucal hydratase domain-containing protein n=1 Tax=Flavilitoribacter nigricans (strain ATCC 23147 / DSM 23189 / NBRC 102662 / NCIMB 1420 / SS-2) TaxID=1122177 RepID=A0A2D0NDQ6_FLAN2|nr:DUF1080 domain-containing protein [Flavilitoribacter nigricans]PHN06538.1 hypothetical protein CRP01_09545 [Flavilitoribacter nigricans DSM 23189 = NBRC 102662]